jgi:hypothetical protein
VLYHPPKGGGRSRKKQGKKLNKSRLIGYMHFTPVYETADYIYTHVSLTTGGLCPKSSSCNTNNETKQKKIKLKDNSTFIAVVFTSITAKHCLPYWIPCV